MSRQKHFICFSERRERKRKKEKEKAKAKQISALSFAVDEEEEDGDDDDDDETGIDLVIDHFHGNHYYFLDHCHCKNHKLLSPLCQSSASPLS